MNSRRERGGSTSSPLPQLPEAELRKLYLEHALTAAQTAARVGGSST
jgi:hypothetical protein